MRLLKGAFFISLKIWGLGLDQLCPTKIAYGAKNYVTILNQGHTLNGLLWS